MKRWALGLLLLLMAAASIFVWLARDRGVRAETVTVGQGDVVESLDEDGVVKSDVEVPLKPQLTARLERLAVTSGTSVHSGQLIAQLDDSEAQAALAQAQAQEEVARSAVEEAQASLAATRQRLAAEVASAQAGRDSAYFNLRKVQRGPRQEEVGRAEALLRQAEARRKDAETDLERKQQLFQQDAIPRRELEAAQLQQKVARAASQEARQNLLMLQRGTRWEDRGSAAAELRRGQAQIELAQAQTGQVRVQEAQASSARRRVESAAAEVRRLRAGLDKTVMRAPTSGLVVIENVQVGELVTLNTTVARIVDPRKCWVEVLVDESDRGKVQLGQNVRVTCDAYPGEHFSGRLARIDSIAFLKRELRNSPTQDEDRVFRARIELGPEAAQRLFPGMSVFAEIVLGQPNHVLTVPRQSLLQREGQWQVYVVEAGRARLRNLTIGRRDAQSAEVQAGLKEGEKVILNPNSVKEGKVVLP